MARMTRITRIEAVNRRPTQPTPGDLSGVAHLSLSGIAITRTSGGCSHTFHLCHPFAKRFESVSGQVGRERLRPSSEVTSGRFKQLRPFSVSFRGQKPFMEGDDAVGDAFGKGQGEEKFRGDTVVNQLGMVPETEPLVIFRIAHQSAASASQLFEHGKACFHKGFAGASFYCLPLGSQALLECLVSPFSRAVKHSEDLVRIRTPGFRPATRAVSS